ncbi:NADase-type glycan-binding domain-containing protein [Streptomyces spinoverrucosus]|uniref:NADase-type glycan-binding domain-containing protein n=1 Tax=Streptomyces spinoverrucosus TaxID=284043 RepID=UPI0011437B63|nr:zinc ribbon domain-containing protein [Streptomyces spinoverrucosus]
MGTDEDDDDDDFLARLLADDEDEDDGKSKKGKDEDDDEDNDDDEDFLARLLADEDNDDDELSLPEVKDGSGDEDDEEDDDDFLARLLAEIDDEDDEEQDGAARSGVTGGGTQEPAAVLPQATAPRRPAVQRTRSTRRPQPGDRLCSPCGQSNPSHRTFCSRCGESLETSAEVRLPWWKRLLPKRRSTAYEAGTRPGQPGAKTKRGLPTASSLVGPVRMVASVAAVAATTLYALHPPFQQAVTKEVSEFNRKVQATIKPEFSPVNPLRVTSGAKSPAGHPAATIADGGKNSFWAFSDHAGTVSVSLKFEDPAELDQMVVHSGALEEFRSYSRPKQLRVVYPDGHTQKVTLKDTPEPQHVTLEGRTADRLEIRIDSFYHSPKGGLAALSEVEFFAQVDGLF